ncbi:hypothetical protein [Bifidobacterium scaligerum]|uniref:1,4-beta-xylanase n=1 Tax=Bifidobacterium scaligerum TaxID=2052656 RepID=A0A2M9HP99_9BIFI|nr:hypothetical protein [Bifidobacterium scaligerum]PJM78652.1 hypothetical protein CUU80_07880 [Bifidobacterium scaligerum]
MRNSSRLLKCLSAVAAAALLLGAAGTAMAVDTNTQNDPDVLLGTFWNTNADGTLSNSIYMSTDGVHFNKLSTAITSNSSTDMGEFQQDAGLFYKNGAFWLNSGWAWSDPDDTDNLTKGHFLQPMYSSSKDLTTWTQPRGWAQYKSDGWVENDKVSELFPTELPPSCPVDETRCQGDGQGHTVDGSFDSAGAESFEDEDGTTWFVSTAGYYGPKHGDDRVQPTITNKVFIASVKNLDRTSKMDTETDGRSFPPTGSSDQKLYPVNLPGISQNILDPALFKSDGKYYLSLEADGHIAVFSIDDLSNASDASKWTEVTGDAFNRIGFEGPSLTKFNGKYLMYADRLAVDGGVGVHVATTTDVNNWPSGYPAQVVATDAAGNSFTPRHGTVIAVTDPTAKKIVWDLYRSENFPQASTLDVAQYKEKDGQALDKSQWTAPTENGKVFAGWYKDKDFTQPLEESTTSGQAYAKFVDANVLSVKRQVTYNSTLQSDKVSLRLLTTVDSLNYQVAGFNIQQGSNAPKDRSSTAVYGQLKEYNKNTSGENAVMDSIKPTLFSSDSAYFVSYGIWNIPNNAFSTSFTVTPYWVTPDGTRVNGIARTFTVAEAIQAQAGSSTWPPVVTSSDTDK